MARIGGWLLSRREPWNANKQSSRVGITGFTLLMIAGLLLANTLFFAKYLSSKKEVIKITPVSITYKVDGGTVAETYPKVKWYKDSSRQWQEVDTTLKVQGDTLTADELPYKVIFSKKVDKPLTFTLGLNSIYFVPVLKGVQAKGTKSSNLTGTRNSEPRTRIQNNRVTYYNIYKNTNLERIVTAQGLKQNYVLTAEGHPTNFSEKIESKLTIKKLNDGSLSYYEGSKVIATSPKPHLTDVKGKVVQLSYALSRDKLTISLPPLKGLSYPIAIDPSIFHTLADFQTGTATQVDSSTLPVKLAEQSPGVYYSSGNMVSSTVDAGAGKIARVISISRETAGEGQTGQPANTSYENLGLPTNLNVQAAPLPDVAANLTWSAPSQGSVDHYNIYRFSEEITNDNLGLARLVADDVKNTAYTDKSVYTGETYYYQVSAVDTLGNESDVSIYVENDNVSISGISPHEDFSILSNLCRNCHQVHKGVAPKKIFRKVGEELCYTCHDGTGSSIDIKSVYKDKAAHDKYLAAPQDTDIKCTQCHHPHGATDYPEGGPKMTKKFEEKLCFKCHDDPANSDKGINIKERFTALSSDTAKHNVDDETQVNSEIECLSCHNSHMNNRENKTIDPDNKANLYQLPSVMIGGGISRVEETELSVAYTGNWYTATGSGLSGESRKYSLSAGATATITFIGTEVTWISYAGPYQGIAEVYIDNVFQQNVDLYQPINIAQADVYTKTGLASGSHTLRVMVKGTRNPLSGGYYVSVDAFDVKVITQIVSNYIDFCNKCHDNDPPAGVAIPPGLINIASVYPTDYHGQAQGSGATSPLSMKAPFYRGADAIPCQLCHDQHGSSNVFHFNEKVNENESVSVTEENGQGAYSLCSSCHQGTVNDFHKECVDCHFDEGHDDRAPMTFEDLNCFDCHKHGRRNFTPYPGGDSDPNCDMGSCHPTYESTF